MKNKETETGIAAGAGSAPTLKDVAEAAGVSISTVSRALRTGKGVDSDLRRRISDVAREVGYAARESARKVFTLLSMDLHTNDAAGFYAEIIDGITSELARQGVSMELVFLRSLPEDTARISAMIENEPGCGIILVAVDDQTIVDAAGKNPAIMLVNRYDAQMRYDCVAPDNRQGAFLATRHLIESGCKRIAHFTSLQRTTIRDRFAGYSAALETAGMPLDKDLIFDVTNLEPRPGNEAVLRAFDEGKLKGVDGIFCASDMVAVGVIEGLQQRNLRIPEDIRVVGFDNTRITARYRPGITTMAIDLDTLGRRAALQVLERMDNPSGPAIRQLIGCSLLQRETT